jgi:hypothetical protein
MVADAGGPTASTLAAGASGHWQLGRDRRTPGFCIRIADID